MVNKQGKKKLIPKTSGPRIKPLSRKQQKAKAKQELANRNKLPSSFSLTRKSIATIRQFWKSLMGIMLVYLVLNAVFASGIGNLNTDVQTIKDNLSASGSGSHSVYSGVGGFLQLALSSGAASSATGFTFQGFLTVFIALTVIWALRQMLANKKIKVKEAFYSSTTPLVPFLLVILIIMIQLLPVTLGSSIISAIISSLGSVSAFWSGVFIVAFVALLSWSLYMLSASIFALYIVTLPGMVPRKALRSAVNLVSLRRLVVIRKALFAPIFLLCALGIIIVPLILYATVLVTPVFYILSAFSILFIITYLYTLYRSLLD